MAKSLVYIIVLLMIASSGYAVSADSLFAQANRQYDDQNFEEALETYKRIESNGFESASLYYNIGNCYIKEGAFGPAIQYYLKALRLKPGDEEIETNLAFARQFMPTRLEGVEINPVTTFFDSLVDSFTLKTLAWVSSIFFVLFFLLLSYRVYSRSDGLAVKIILYVLLVIVLSTSSLTTYKYRTEVLTEKGVIIADETNVYSSPNEDGELEFIGGFGLIVEVEKANQDFYLVVFENKRKGWVKKEDIGLI